MKNLPATDEAIAEYVEWSKRSPEPTWTNVVVLSLIARIEALKREATEPLLSGLRMENGALDIELCGRAVEQMTALWATSLIKAKNYSEAILQCKSDVTGEDLWFTVTLQKQGRPTPHELRQKFERLYNEEKSKNAK